MNHDEYFFSFTYGPTSEVWLVTPDGILLAKREAETAGDLIDAMKALSDMARAMWQQEAFLHIGKQQFLADGSRGDGISDVLRVNAYTFNKEEIQA